MSTDSDPTELQRLSARVAALAAEVTELRAELTAARGRINLSMCGQLRCPACGSRQLFYSPQVLDRSNAGRQKLALAEKGIFRARTEGELETYVCGQCGLVKWHVKDPEALGDQLTALGSATMDDSPYGK